MVNPFRKSFNFSHTTSNDDTCKRSKRHSLRVITSKMDDIVVDTMMTKDYTSAQSPLLIANSYSSPASRMRQRLSSFFRISSSPTASIITKEAHENMRHDVMIKKPYSLSLESDHQQQYDLVMTSTPLLVDDSHSIITTSSDITDPAPPASPMTMTTEVRFQEECQRLSLPSCCTSFLAYQVQHILGSTLDEVDEEIDKDWECSRNKLKLSLTLLNNTHMSKFIYK
ncbi:uncharacterized protein BX663DRAFT_291103 [Cokeromyces recurvatus]|uniref:uncharacterized protein n=1 Tax=Cokeromyces recurvatus TaxID=90255 RepID=UPI00221ECC86|nr:uncharacterized protein BX663DRAFT_291103 [Cokeromyces recurvatus]KAI7905708.1 hypothetical protein BX663DRAFT_291103 [Cokeromyces recurvatus]